MAKTPAERKARSTDEKQCVYCGVGGKLTSDHIPPKNLFSHPRPSNLITVPCCERCNKALELDDEYFRLMLILRDDVGAHPEFNKTWPTVYRSLKRRRGHGFTQNLLMDLQHRPVFSNGGIFVGYLPTYSVELHRLDRVAERIATGLYYHEFGERLPKEYHALAYNADGVQGNAAGIQAIQELCRRLPNSTNKTIGSGVFTYAFSRANDNLYATVWLMTFFGCFQFMCVTLPKKFGKKKYVSR